MGKTTEGAVTVEELQRRCEALDDQLRRLVKTEQRLFLSQRALSRQVARFDALNRFAVALGPAPEPTRIAELAADMVFGIFPFDQCVAFRAGRDATVSAFAVRSVPGRRRQSAERLRAARGQTWPCRQTNASPFIGPADRLRRDRPALAAMVDASAAIFAGAASSEPESPSIVLVLPIAEASTPPLGYLLFERFTGSISFHEELPTERDVAFLNLVGQQVAAAMIQAGLVADLKDSYEKLAAAQRDLVLRERLAALGELAAVVAHEVRNPVAVIFNSLSTLRRTVTQEGQTGMLLDIVQEEARRLADIVSELIDFARPNPPRFRPESIDKVVKDAIEHVRAASAEPVLVDILLDGGPLPAVDSDSRMIRQVLSNLLHNALHASSEARPVTVRLATDQRGDAHWVQIEVIDRGDGIEPGALPRIFEPFFTTKAAGSGLGLAVVKRFVELHGGTVSVLSTPADGTAFTVRLPCDHGDD